VDEASRLVEVDEPSRLVLAKLEMELTTTREQLTREIQLRKAESVRHAAVEREWSRKALASSSGTMARDVSPAIDSPRRYPAQLVATALATLAMALGLAFLMGRSCGSGRDRTEVVAPEAPLAESTPPPAVAPPPTDPAPAPWPLLEGTGFKTSRKGNELTVRFNYGVFARGTELTGTACQDLRRIANTLTPAIGQLHLEVEGHTDASPVSAGRPYASNRELGLARAKVVVDYLSKQCGLPPDALSATSAGDANPPYANTTPESRRLNRTVVLKLTSDAGR
jgi:flagellar motor protein MotB